MPNPLAKVAAKIRREGLLSTLDTAWLKGFTLLGHLRLSNLLGGLRNLWRLPALRRRHRDGTLNLGCGPDRRAGWLNADLGLVGDVHLNVARRFPFADDWFQTVFSEHLLEHLTEPQAANCLRECYRVLKPGGLIRVSVPDLAYSVALYHDRTEAGLAHRVEAAAVSQWKYPPGYVPTAAQALNDIFYLWEHQHLFDAEDLQRMLLDAGFAAPTLYPALAPQEPAAGPEGRTHGSLIAEARKPLS